MSATDLLLLSLALFSLGGVAGLLLRANDRAAIGAAGFAGAAGGAVGLVAGLLALTAPAATVDLGGPFPFARLLLRLDPLSGLMVAVICGLALVASIYSLAYVREYAGRGVGAMGFFTAIKTCLLKYVVFRGRASRSEFWWFVLFGHLLIFLVTMFDVIVLGTGVTEKFTNFKTGESGGIESIHWKMYDSSYNPDIIFFALLLPTVAASVRRLHDIGRSGVWVLIAIAIPICVFVSSFIFYILNLEMAAIAVIIVSALLLIVGFFVLLFWWVQPSQGGRNDYDLLPPASSVRDEPRLG